MTGMLASVNCLEEALLIETLDVDIIDLKQPARGALGALEIADVAAIVAALRSDSVVSATVGDLPMQPDLVASAVAGMTATGVDYVKIGLFPGGDWSGSIAAAGRFADKQSLIAVLFADAQPDFSVVPLLAHAGFRGVMLDTMDKTSGSLTDWLSLERLERFLSLAREHALLTGLAGSLRQADVSALLPLAADYLGFRGALCRQHNRVAALDPARIAAIRALFSAAEAGACVAYDPA